MLHPTPGYHRWIAGQSPAERWYYRLQVAGHRYVKDTRAAALAPEFAAAGAARQREDSADRLREMVDQAAHQLAPGEPGTGVRDRLWAEAVAVGESLVALAVVMNEDGTKERAYAVGEEFTRALGVLNDELALLRIPF
jgi:hypothetical protein